MKRSDLVCGGALVLFGLAAIFLVIPGQTVPGDEGEIAPALLPTVAMWMVVVCALWQIIDALVRADDGGDAGAGGLDPFAAVFLVVAGAGLAVIVGVLAGLGYLVGGIVITLAIGFAMRPAGAQRWWLIAIAVVLPVAIHLLAWQGLRLALP